MKRRLLAPAVAAGLLLVPAPVATAHGGGGSCAAFGVDHVAVDAKVLQPSGQLVSQFARARGGSRGVVRAAPELREACDD